MGFEQMPQQSAEQEKNKDANNEEWEYRIDIGTYFSEGDECDVLVIDDPAEGITEIKLNGLEYSDVQKVKLFAQNIATDAQRMEEKFDIKEPADEVREGRLRRNIYDKDAELVVASSTPEDIIKSNGVLYYIHVMTEKFVKDLRAKSGNSAQ